MFWLSFSKGDWFRPVNKEKYDEQFESVFGRKEIKTWNPDGEEESQDGVHPADTDPEGIRASSSQPEGPNRGGSKE